MTAISQPAGRLGACHPFGCATRTTNIVVTATADGFGSKGSAYLLVFTYACTVPPFVGGQRDLRKEDWAREDRANEGWKFKKRIFPPQPDVQAPACRRASPELYSYMKGAAWSRAVGAARKGGSARAKPPADKTVRLLRRLPLEPGAVQGADVTRALLAAPANARPPRRPSVILEARIFHLRHAAQGHQSSGPDATTSRVCTAQPAFSDGVHQRRSRNLPARRARPLRSRRGATSARPAFAAAEKDGTRP
jgi:hypothetical protein